METVGIVLLGLFTGAALLTASVLAVARFVRTRRIRREEWYRRFLTEGLPSAGTALVAQHIGRDPMSFFRAYVWYCDGLEPDPRTRDRIRDAIIEAGVDLGLIRDLSRRSAAIRARAGIYLGYSRNERAIRALVNALEVEPKAFVKLRYAYGLQQSGFGAAIPSILDTLASLPPEYEPRMRAVLLEFGDDLLDYVALIQDRPQPQLQRLVIDVAARYPTESLHAALEGLLHAEEPDVAREAFRVMASQYGSPMYLAEHLADSDTYTRNLAIEALGQTPSENTIDLVTPHLAVPETRKSAVLALSEVLRHNPRLYARMLDTLRRASDAGVRSGLAEALAPRAEYLVQAAVREKWADAPDVLAMLLRTRKATGILSYLNRSVDPHTIEEVTSMIGPTIRADPWLREEYGLYARDEVLSALALEREEESRERGERQGENVRFSLLSLTLAFAILGPIGAFVITAVVSDSAVALSVPDYLQFFSLGFGFYAFALNTVYLVLLVFAAFGVIRQHESWQTKPLSMLFTSGVLPSVSIIVPAYNEELNVVENVTALLNLRYPDYEVVVVNDGSTDETLESLVEHFELERADVFLHGYLKTRSVRGVYRNSRLPGLVVIDKSNGGKADSLNAGLNAARKEYFAAIDSDSVLERDALLELAAGFLDTDTPVVAAGGNIMPVNGCSVDRGHIEQVRLPDRMLPRFQTMEYVRAFMNGRTGWAQLGSLLIISGAFGLFRTRDVVDSRGYLTSSERYTKDTVAEDMELVVRVTHDLTRAGVAHAVQYAANANCWTEVPETPRILAAQRDRWQRGLIDVLFFHSSMLLNPKYGRSGLVALPYYYVFELFGPWIELQGYVFFIAALSLGFLPGELIWFVIAATIPLGMLTSAVAVMLVEWHRKIYRRRDRWGLLALALLENFGYRQFSNLLRIRGYVSALGRRSGWGEMKRRGFAAPPRR